MGEAAGEGAKQGERRWIGESGSLVEKCDVCGCLCFYFRQLSTKACIEFFRRFREKEILGISMFRSNASNSVKIPDNNIQANDVNKMILLYFSGMHMETLQYGTVILEVLHN
jgi:hypothetical protein